MSLTRHVFAGVAWAAAALTLILSVSAQEPSSRVPQDKNPIRFSAFGVNMNTGTSGRVEIAIERWSTDAERKALVDLVGTATDKVGGQDKLLDALEDVKPRVGFIRTPNSIGWDLKYARENTLPDGTRQIVIATDKPVSFLAVVSNARTLDYPFTLIEMRFPKGSSKGEGKLLTQTSIATKNGRLELEMYGREPTRLTTITQADQ